MAVSHPGDPQRAITLLSFAAFASAASVRVCDPMLPDLAREFDTTPGSAANVVWAFLVVYGLTQAFYGPLGDRIGKYRLVAWTALGCTVGTLAGAFAGSLEWLVVTRALAGATAGGIIPLCLAWIGDAIPYERRQATLARFLIGQIFGVIGGQFIGGIFADTLGWRAAFVFLAAVYLVVGWLVLRESRLNASTFPVPQDAGVRKGMLGPALDVLRDPWARTILTVVFIEGTLLFGGLALLPTYLHLRFGLSLTMAGALTAIFGIGGLAYILFAGFFVRRLGEVGLATIGGLWLGCAWLLLALGSSWHWAIPGAFLIGLGFYKLHNTLQTNATQMAPRTRGTAVSMFASALFLGQATGVFLAARAFEAWGGPALFLGIAVCIPVLALIFARLLKRHHRSRPAALA